MGSIHDYDIEEIFVCNNKLLNLVTEGKHLINTTYSSSPCPSQVAHKTPPQTPYLPDGSGLHNLYNIEYTGKLFLYCNYFHYVFFKL